MSEAYRIDGKAFAEKLRARVAEVAASFEARSAATRTDLIAAWQARGIDLFEVSAGASVVDPLLKFFRQRAQRRRR